MQATSTSTVMTITIIGKKSYSRSPQFKVRRIYESSVFRRTLHIGLSSGFRKISWEVVLAKAYKLKLITLFLHLDMFVLSDLTTIYSRHFVTRQHLRLKTAEES